MSLIVSETANSQTFVRNKKGKIVGIIQGTDTLHAFDIAESRILHEFLVKKRLLEERIIVKDSLISNLEFRIWEVERRYEDLLLNSGQSAEQLRKELRIARDERNELKGDLRKHKRKLFWANVRTVTVAVIGAIIILVVGK